MSLQTEYKDLQIEYNEDNNEWRIQTGSRYDQYERFDTLKSAKGWIDRQNRIKYIPVEIWILIGSSWNKQGFKNIKQCTATRPHHSSKFWITRNGSRSSEYGEDLFLDIPENRKLFPQIADIERQIKELESTKSQLIKQLQTLKEMKKVE